jgi:hypothetical protein
MRRNKTRRHLKGRRATRRRRDRKQRGGAAATSAKSWIDAVISKINLLPDQKINSFSDLKDESELTLTAPTTTEEWKLGNRYMDVTINDGVSTRTEDIRNMALRVRDVISSIMMRTDLDTVTPMEFISMIGDPNRRADDAQLDSLNYLLTRENALLMLADRETLPMKDPVTTLSDAAKEHPLFIWALAINGSGEAVAELFDESALTKALSETSAD